MLIFRDILLLGFLNPVSLEEFFKRLHQQIYDSLFDVLIISILIAIMIVGVSENVIGFFGDNAKIRFYVRTITTIVPNIVALLFLIKYSSYLIVSIEKHKDNQTFKVLEYLGVNPVTIYITPAIFSGIISILLLSFFTAFLSITFSGYLFKLFLGTSPSFFYNTVLSNLNIGDMLKFTFLSIIFGVALTLIPMYNTYSLNTINRSTKQLSSGLVRIFYLYLFISTVGFIFL